MRVWQALAFLSFTALAISIVKAYWELMSSDD